MVFVPWHILQTNLPEINTFSIFIDMDLCTRACSFYNSDIFREVILQATISKTAFTFHVQNIKFNDILVFALTLKLTYLRTPWKIKMDQSPSSSPRS